MSDCADARWLIVNADDFGLSRSVNEGILHAFRHGIVRSASLIATGRAFEHAVEFACSEPGLDIGVHLTAVDGRAALPLAEVSGLVNRRGRFPRTPLPTIAKLCVSRVANWHLEREFRAQIERVLRYRVSISHLDSHCHLHLLPWVFRMVVHLAEEYAIPWVRLPVLSAADCRRVASWRGIQLLAAGWMARACVRQLATEGWSCRFPDHTLGIECSGYLDEQWLTRQIGNMPAGVNELLCHPGFEVPSLGRRYRRYPGMGYQRLREAQALTSPRIRQMIDECRIGLSSFRELVGVLHSHRDRAAVHTV